jgi:hypothetical protein
MEPNMFVAHQHSNHQHFANPLPSSLRNCPSFSSNDIARLRVIGSSGVDAVKPKPFFAALCAFLCLCWSSFSLPPTHGLTSCLNGVKELG